MKPNRGYLFALFGTIAAVVCFGASLTPCPRLAFTAAIASALGWAFAYLTEVLWQKRLTETRACTGWKDNELEGSYLVTSEGKEYKIISNKANSIKAERL